MKDRWQRPGSERSNEQQILQHIEHVRNRKTKVVQKGKEVCLEFLCERNGFPFPESRGASVTWVGPFS
jgi:hypothetical protein